MDINLTDDFFLTQGLPSAQSHALTKHVMEIVRHHPPSHAWSLLTNTVLNRTIPFACHHALFSLLFPDWHQTPHLAPAWLPPQALQEQAHITRYREQKGLATTTELSHFAHQHYREFWADVVNLLKIQFANPPSTTVDFSEGLTKPLWFKGGRLNIAANCFHAQPDATAILTHEPDGTITTMTYAELNCLSNQIAHSLQQHGCQTGDAIAVIMPMHATAVAIYLGIIKMGAHVVSIPDSFSANEMAKRLSQTKIKLVLTQDHVRWAGKTFSLYQKCQQVPYTQGSRPQHVVLRLNPQDTLPCCLEQDISWERFLRDDTEFTPVHSDPMSPIHVLFSSGTTSTPKAIPWNHTTAIKAASDAYFHHNIHPGDVLAWPTNLGWMMGPWLIFASLLNQATLALFPDAPKDVVFGRFVENANVTMLGVVPTLVSTWRQTACMETCDWKQIKVLSSTGECSNPDDMLYLMWLAGYKPIIEYCGGTEIGGAYITSHVAEPNCPSVLTMPALGLQFTLIHHDGEEPNVGEVALIPPSLGLSTVLMNGDHDKSYYQHMPTQPDGTPLRRHGDQIKRLSEYAYTMMGRVDDSMNLGGIKVSSAEIERAIRGLEGIGEVAAIAVSQQGPSRLIIYATTDMPLNKVTVLDAMQQRINQTLNPLFKISDLVFLDALPKTASNKIMRRELRQLYETQSLSK